MSRGSHRNPFTWSFLALLVCLSAYVACSRDELLTLTLTQAELQERVNGVFPVTTTQVLAQVTLDEPKVVLAEGTDRITLELRVSVALPLVPIQQGRLAVSGVPEYRQAEKAFYLVQPRLESLVIPGVPPAQVELVKVPVEAVAKSALDSNPVYRLSGGDRNESAVGRVLTGVTVRDRKLVLTLGLPR